MSDFTVLIQGPLNPISIQALDYYRTIGPIVISTWHCDMAMFDGIDLRGIDLRVSPAPEPVYFLKKPNHTFTHQIHSIRNGLEMVRTPYVIRTRSDERWMNLGPIIDRFKETKKVVCGNIFFKRWNDISSHIGDHLFIGHTKFLYNAYDDLINSPDMYKGCYCAEQAAAIAIHNAYQENRFYPIEFTSIFDVIDINELAPFVASWQHGGKQYIDHFECNEVIKSMEEL